MSAAPKEIKDIQKETGNFLQSFKTLQLGTANKQGIATASYAPFALDEHNNFLIYVSELSEHTANLQLAKSVSVMLIESEDRAEHLFARKRMTFKCDVENIARDSQAFEQAMQLMTDSFGDFIAFMKKLQDFHLFQLKPFYATYVRHINDRGHRQS